MSRESFVPDRLLSRKELAEYLSISSSQLVYLLREGLPGIPVSQDGMNRITYRFDVNEVTKWLRKKHQSSPQDDARRTLLKKRNSGGAR